MAYQEKDFQREFNKFLKYSWDDTSVFELKICKGKSLPFSAVKEHQVNALIAAHRDKIIYKIPDDGFDQKPFDCFMIRRAFAYVVILFYVPRKEKKFYMIDIDNWMIEVQYSKRKSITEERARAIGIPFVLK